MYNLLMNDFVIHYYHDYREIVMMIIDMMFLIIAQHYMGRLLLGHKQGAIMRTVRIATCAARPAATLPQDLTHPLQSDAPVTRSRE